MKSIVSEKDIQNAMLTYLNRRGAFAWPTMSVGVWDPTRKIYRKNSNVWFRKGIPDIQMIFMGHVILVEVKKPGGYASQDQKEFLLDYKRHGGRCFVAKSLKELDEKLIAEDIGWTKGVF